MIPGASREDLTVIEPPPYRIRQAPDTVEAWSTFRLPFQPRGNAVHLKTELAAGISGLSPRSGEILDCTYWSGATSFVDTENALVYNVGESCFSKAATHGIRFERVFQQPPSCPENLPDPGALHYMAYRTVAPSGEFTNWRRGKTIATWTDADWPEKAGTSPTLFWLAIRKVHPQRLGNLRERAGLFGLRLTVTGGGRPIRPANMIKPMFDAAVSAFHVHDEPAAMAKALERLAARGHGDVATLGQLLTDPRFDLLGARNLLSAFRGGATADGVKWNPEDERCVAGELLWAPSQDAKRFSGELFEVLRRPT
jgi:hypothetical protein